MRLTIFGSGYVGLVTGACLAAAGHHVVCADISEAKIAMLNNGEVPIYEPGLSQKIQTCMEAGRLEFTTDAAHAVKHGDTIFIAVGTPPDEDGSADISAVLSVAATIATHMDGHKLVINKSTVPVGSVDKVRATITARLQELGKSLTFDVASNPEFLKEGNAIDDFEKPDRIVIGTDSDIAEQTLRDIYTPFNRRLDRIIAMDVRSAELTKYAANAMLATKISFMNELANIADAVGADIEQVRIGIGSDTRIGYHFIYAGTGYGGACFPKDVRALAATARAHDVPSQLISAIQDVNERQKTVLPAKIMRHFKGDIAGRTFAVWGLAFKPNTDDMREAPARVIMESLWAAGASVRAYDPKAMEECTRIYGTRDDLTLCGNANDALKGTDGLIIVTEWREFQALDIAYMREVMNGLVIFDGRNIHDPARLGAQGITYYGIGRGN